MQFIFIINAIRTVVIEYRLVVAREKRRRRGIRVNANHARLIFRIRYCWYRTLNGLRRYTGIAGRKRIDGQNIVKCRFVLQAQNNF